MSGVNNYSSFLWGSFLFLLFSGCATGTRLTKSECLLLPAQEVVINGSKEDPYLAELQTQLLAGDIQSAKTASASVFYSPSPAAFSGNGKVVISSSLIAKLGSEAELAFILAHEISHELLGHNSALCKSTFNHSLRPKFELEADQHALTLLSRAGYDPQAAFDALSVGYLNLEDQEPSYPDLTYRISSLKQSLRGLVPNHVRTGTSRDFLKFKHRVGLLSNP